MGHPADAQTHRGPHPGLHSGGGRDQPDPVGGDATRLDRHLLQQESRDSEGLICFLSNICHHSTSQRKTDTIVKKKK